MADLPTGDELKAALEAWVNIHDDDPRSPVNEDTLHELLASTLGDDSGDAKVIKAEVVSLENVEDYDGSYRVLGTFNIKSLHRTDSRDSDTLGPNDIPDWKEELIINADRRGGEWRVADVRLAP